MLPWKKRIFLSVCSLLIIISQFPGAQAVEYDPVIELSKDSSEPGSVVIDVSNSDSVKGYNLFRGDLLTPFAYGHDNQMECYLDGAITEHTIVNDQFDGTTYYYILASVYDAGQGCQVEYGVDSDSTERVPSQNECPLVEADVAAGMVYYCRGGEPAELIGSGVGGSGNYSYNWVPPSDLVIPDPINEPWRALVSPNFTRTYTLIVTDLDSGCTAQAQVIVEVPSSFRADAGNDKGTCDRETRIGGSPTAIGGSGDFSYQWEPASDIIVDLGKESSPNHPNPLVNPIADTEFTVTVTDNTYSCDMQDAVNVTVGSPGVECGGSIPWGPNQGQCAPDWNPPSPLLDQNGQPVSLYDYECDVILLVLSTMWCGPCQNEASQAEQLFHDYESQGFIIIEVLFDNLSYDDPTLADLQAWVDMFGLTTPVLADVNERVWGMYDNSGFVPQNVVIGRDKVVYYHDSGYNEAAIRNAIESLL
jgi:peroxiredoxin